MVNHYVNRLKDKKLNWHINRRPIAAIAVKGIDRELWLLGPLR